METVEILDISNTHLNDSVIKAISESNYLKNLKNLTLFETPFIQPKSLTTLIKAKLNENFNIK